MLGTTSPDILTGLIRLLGDPGAVKAELSDLLATKQSAETATETLRATKAELDKRTQGLDSREKLLDDREDVIADKERQTQRALDEAGQVAVKAKTDAASSQKAWETKKSQLDAATADLASREQSLLSGNQAHQAREAEITKRETALSTAEQDLKQRKAEVEKTAADYQEKIAELKRLAG